MNLAGRKSIGPDVWSKALILLLFASAFLAGCSSSNQAQLEPLPEVELPDPVDLASERSSAPSTTGDVGASDDISKSDSWTPIFVDQFGYRPGDPKVAVIANPEIGFNASFDFSPGEVLEVRSVDDDSVAFSGGADVWADGELHTQSGDRGWFFDFSPLDEPGTYYVVDVASGTRTGAFQIDEDVYDEVLVAALRAFWFNRGNTPHPEEFGGHWSDDAAYVGDDQDTEARSVDDKLNNATAKDLSGGWFDAGDTNKYVTFASEPVHLLLSAYQANANVFDDDLGIPESGNGIPDILDEVKWEIDWLERMQLEDGGVLTKVGVIEWGSLPTPSDNYSPRYYEEVCSSATIAAAGMFAHAAIVFAETPGLADHVDRLEQRARSAWDWYQSNPKKEDCDSGEVKAGDADLTIAEQAMSEVVAAVYLGALTEEPRYDQVVRQRFDSMSPFLHDGFNSYFPHQGDALLFYRSWPLADSPTVLAIDQRIAQLRDESPLYGVDADADLYRAFMPDESYHWGSNRVKANIGYSNLAVGDVPNGLERALGHLNYFHGVNPTGLVYLSNMEDLGAEQSVGRLLHYWFGAGSIYDIDQGSAIGVAPGYLVGGPNSGYSGAASPPAGQPAQKSYRDWSAASEPVWEITEPAIYYQASYVRLLAAILATESS